MRESILQGEIVKLLLLYNVFHFSIPNESIGIKWGARMKRMGRKKGAPDMVLCFDGGRTVFVEIKTETGRQSQYQLNFQQLSEALGFTYYIWRSIDDAIKFLKMEGIIK